MTAPIYQRLLALDQELEALRSSLQALQARLAACRPAAGMPPAAALELPPDDAAWQDYLRAYV